MLDLESDVVFAAMKRIKEAKIMKLPVCNVLISR